MKAFDKRIASVASWLALSTAWSVPAFAQTTPVAAQATPTLTPASAEGNDDIIVTAQKREQSMQDVPMSIQAASGDRLLNLGIREPSDLTKLVSGFNFNQSIYGTNVFTIRGVGFQDSTLGAGPTVTVYVDQVPVPYSAETNGVALDVQRVEVLKGPQGTLFGQNATGGAINYVPNAPGSTFKAGFDASYGRFNRVDLSGYINVPITDTLAVRFAAQLQRGSAWQREYTTIQRPDAYYANINRQDRLGERDFLNGRMLVDWRPTDRLKLSLNVNGWRDKSEQVAAQFFGVEIKGSNTPPNPGFLNFPVAPRDALYASWDPNWDYHQNNWMVSTSLRADYDLDNDMKVTSLTSYQRFHRYQPLDADGTSYNDTFLINSGDIKTFYQELRLEGRFGSTGSWVVGGNYEHDSIYDQFYQTYADSSAKIVFGLPLINNIDFSDQKVKTYGVFANAEYPILPGLSVQGGIRYTKADRDYQGCGKDAGDGLAAAVFDRISAYLRSLTGLPPVAPIGVGQCFSMQIAPTFIPSLDHNSLSESNVSWRAGLNWNVTKQTLLYANVSKGYKAGSFPTISVSVNRPQLRAVTQESILAFEAGLKTEIGKLQLNLAGFYYKYNDKQILGAVLDPVFGSLNALVNVPKSHIIGVDLSGTWRPIRGLTISPNFSYIKTKIDDNFVNFDYLGRVVDFGGKPFPYAPEVQANADVEYRHPVGNGNLQGFVGTNVSYTSRSNSFLGEYQRWNLPAHTLIDLRAGVDAGRWRVSVWGRNVTNQFYLVSSTRSNDADARYPGMPVTYGVTLNFRY